MQPVENRRTLTAQALPLSLSWLAIGTMTAIDAITGPAE
jgi:hypothetical protein